MASERGSIELIIGPMFAGKSTELQRRMRRHTIARKSCIGVKYKFDTRYAAEEIATHDHHLIKAFPCTKLEEVQPLLMKYNVIGIDEGQFFPDVIPTPLPARSSSPLNTSPKPAKS